MTKAFVIGIFGLLCVLSMHFLLHNSFEVILGFITGWICYAFIDMLASVIFGEE